jgi:hypothetical protein
VYRYEATDMSARVDGEPTEFGMRAALASVSPTARIELIQPLDDRGPYAKSLAERGGADHFHHVRFDVEDYERSAAHLRHENGLATTLEAEFPQPGGAGPPLVATYHATEPDLGFTVEIGQVPPGFAMPEPEYVYPQGP